MIMDVQASADAAAKITCRPKYRDTQDFEPAPSRAADFPGAQREGFAVSDGDDSQPLGKDTDTHVPLGKTSRSMSFPGT